MRYGETSSEFQLQFSLMATRELMTTMRVCQRQLISRGLKPLSDMIQSFGSFTTVERSSTNLH